MVLHEFNLAILCPGITDVKYHELEATTITSGVFNGTEWRATKYVYVYKWFRYESIYFYFYKSSFRCLLILDSHEQSLMNTRPNCVPCQTLERNVLRRRLTRVAIPASATSSKTKHSTMSRDELIAKLDSLTKGKRNLDKKMHRKSKEFKVLFIFFWYLNCMIVHCYF